MDWNCAKCGNALHLGPGEKVFRSDQCDHCGSDLHACIQCDHYDPKAYNACKESQAERVIDKERPNFCDYFRPRTSGGAKKDTAGDALKKLDDLFK